MKHVIKKYNHYEQWSDSLILQADYPCNLKLFHKLEQKKL